MIPSPPSNGVTTATLDDRIRQAELRLIDREEDLGRRAAALAERARAAMQPRRLMAPAAAATALSLAGAVGWYWLRRGDRWHGASRPPRADRPPRTRWRSMAALAAGAFAAVPLGPALNMVWPLLPARLTKRASLGTALAVVGVALPWLARLGTPSRQRPDAH